MCLCSVAPLRCAVAMLEKDMRLWRPWFLLPLSHLLPGKEQEPLCPWLWVIADFATTQEWTEFCVPEGSWGGCFIRWTFTLSEDQLSRGLSPALLLQSPPGRVTLQTNWTWPCASIP